MPEQEAKVWEAWGLHALSEGTGLEEYTAKQFARAEREPGEDFFSFLNQAEFRGRKLTHEEKQGIANVTFAGGKDTVINVVSSIVVYMSEHPEALEFLRTDEKLILPACEEFVRYVSPLTAITRTCPHAAKVAEQVVPAGSRVGLCWPSANRDGSVFKNPDQSRARPLTQPPYWIWVWPTQLFRCTTCPSGDSHLAEDALPKGASNRTLLLRASNRERNFLHPPSRLRPGDGPL